MSKKNWKAFPLCIPELNTINVIEDHEGNIATALWDGSQFLPGLCPFGYVKKWIKASHAVKVEGEPVGIVAADKFYCFADMYDNEPLFSELL